MVGRKILSVVKLVGEIWWVVGHGWWVVVSVLAQFLPGKICNFQNPSYTQKFLYTHLLELPRLKMEELLNLQIFVLDLLFSPFCRTSNYPNHIFFILVFFFVLEIYVRQIKRLHCQKYSIHFWNIKVSLLDSFSKVSSSSVLFLFFFYLAGLGFRYVYFREGEGDFLFLKNFCIYVTRRRAPRHANSSTFFFSTVIFIFKPDSMYDYRYGGGDGGEGWRRANVDFFLTLGESDLIMTLPSVGIILKFKKRLKI